MLSCRCVFPWRRRLSTQQSVFSIRRRKTEAPLHKFVKKCQIICLIWSKRTQNIWACAVIQIQRRDEAIEGLKEKLVKLLWIRSVCSVSTWWHIKHQQPATQEDFPVRFWQLEEHACLCCGTLSVMRQKRKNWLKCETLIYFYSEWADEACCSDSAVFIPASQTQVRTFCNM